MENLDSDLAREGNAFGTTQIQGYLLETSKWASFLAIVGYVGIGLLVLGCFFWFYAGSNSDLFPGTPVPVGVIGLIYVALAALYFFPVYYMHQFAIKIKEGIRSQSIDSTTAAFQNLKSLYKFMGIFTIVILSIYALIFVGAMITAASM